MSDGRPELKRKVIWDGSDPIRRALSGFFLERDLKCKGDLSRLSVLVRR